MWKSAKQLTPSHVTMHAQSLCARKAVAHRSGDVTYVLSTSSLRSSMTDETGKLTNVRVIMTTSLARRRYVHP